MSNSTNSFLLNLFVITPVCQYLLQSGKFAPRRAFAYAISFLTFMALSAELVQYINCPPNFYHILDVDRSSSSSDLKRAYRRLSIALHPDKNPQPDAAEKFALMTTAYETLIDADKRERYDRIGADSLKDAFKRLSRTESLGQLWSQFLMFYVVWFALIYLLTMGKAANNGRTWSWAAMIIMALVEYNIIFGGYDPLIALLPRMTLKEQMDLLHGLLPSILNGSRLISQFTFIDEDRILLELMGGLMESNRMIYHMLEQIQISVDRKQGKKAVGEESANNGGASSSGADSALGGNPTAAGEGLHLRGNIIKNKLQQSQAQVQQLQAKKQGGGLPGWAIPVGLFVLFNYVLK